MYPFSVCSRDTGSDFSGGRHSGDGTSCCRLVVFEWWFVILLKLFFNFTFDLNIFFESAGARLQSPEPADPPPLGYPRGEGGKKNPVIN